MISRRSAHDEVAIETANFLLDGRPAFLRIDPREKHIETELRDLPIILRNRRQRRTGEATERMVVVTGDAKIAALFAPDMAPTLESGGDHAEGQTIIGTQNRARRKPAAIKNPACLLIAQLLKIPVLCGYGKDDWFNAKPFHGFDIGRTPFQRILVYSWHFEEAGVLPVR